MDIFEKLKKLSLKHSEPVGKPEFIVVGLGNPGVTYENTRHNAGFMAISALEKKYNFNVTTHKFKALTARAVIGGKNCLVMKPETYMNLSGDAVMEAMNFFKIPLNNIIVIFDDISLDVGHMRIRRKGSAGGHNGIKSIIAQCGGEDFPRIKIGVGKKPSPNYDLADWVLSKFTEDELKTLSDVDGRVCEAVELMVQGKISDAMNSFNR